MQAKNKTICSKHTICIILCMQLLLLLNRYSSYAQTFAFHQKYSAHNIPSTAFQNYAVVTTVMDGKGRVWIGTLNGLYVTRGNEVLQFTLSNPNDKVISSLLLHKQYLYVGTNEGINRIQLDNMEADILDLKDAKGHPIHNYCMVVRIDAAQNLLFYTGHNTGAYYEHNLLTGNVRFLFNHSDGYRALRDAVDGRLETLWAVETTGLLEHKVQDGKVERAVYFKGNDDEPVLTIHEAHIDNDDTLWAATDKGLMGMDIGTHGYRLLTFPEYGVYELTDIVLWGKNIICATKNSGIIIWNRQSNTIKHITHKPDDPYSLLSDKVWTLQTVFDKLLLVCTDKGLSVIPLEHNLQHVFVPVDNGIIYNVAYSKSAWLVGIGNNIHLVQPNSFIINETLNLAKDEYALTAKAMRDPSWLIITNKRVMWWQGGKKLKVLSVNAQTRIICERIVKESDTSYFLSGQTGMYRWVIGSDHLVTLHQTDKEPYNWYSTMVPVNDSTVLGNAYLSFIKVLAKEGDSLRPKGLIKTFGNVNDWRYKDDGNIILAGTNGLSLFSGTDFSVSLIDSNFHENIFGVIHMSGDTVLIGTKDMYRLHGGRVQVRPTIYGGFQNISSIDMLLVDDRYTWFSNSYELFRLPFFDVLTKQPYFYLDIYNGNLPATDTITMDADNNLKLAISSVCYLPYVQYKVQYRLSGIEKSVNTLDGANIRYTQLQPGTYTLSVQAVAGTRTLYQRKIVVIVKPAWYQTVWATVGLLLCALGLITGLFMWRVRNIRRKANKALTLHKQMSELENKALRAQMNPHFLFNTLNSINHYILNNDTQEASHYLTRFSKLVRLVLDNSRREYISLDRELEALNIYLELEMMRRNNEFDYSISVKKGVAASSFLVPPLILQPFVENAIWHGLSTISENGFIEITVSPSGDDGICIEIEDNGVGYTPGNEKENKTNHDSFGMSGTRDRLVLMHPDNNYIITPLYDDAGKLSGTKVSVYIFND